MLIMLLLLAALASDVAPVAASSQPEVSVAGLLGGNVIVPIAQLSGGSWVTTWPVAGEEVVRVIRTEADIPRAWYPSGSVPRKWFVWTGKAAPVRVQIGDPVPAEAHCALVWGYSTRLRPSDHETTAIATSIGSGIRQFSGARVGDQLQAVVGEEFKLRLPARTGAVVTSRPEITASCANISGTAQLCGFAAFQRHAEMSTPLYDCPRVSVVQGWLILGAAEPMIVSSRLTETDCDGVELRTQYPEVVIMHGNREFLIVKEHGYEDETFLIFELIDRELRLLLKVPGSGC